MNGWAVCCESTLRQAEKKSESSGEDAVEGCNSTLGRVSGKEVMDPGELEAMRGQTPLWPTINTDNLKKELKEEG